MPLNLSFCEIDTHTDLSRIRLRIGDIELTSVPQLISDHFRDLSANAFFLSRRELGSIFVAGHRLADLTYLLDDRIVAEACEEDTDQRVGAQGSFTFDQGCAFLDGVLSTLEYVLVNSLLAKDAIAAQVKSDIAGARGPEGLPPLPEGRLRSGGSPGPAQGPSARPGKGLAGQAEAGHVWSILSPLVPEAVQVAAD